MNVVDIRLKKKEHHGFNSWNKSVYDTDEQIINLGKINPIDVLQNSTRLYSSVTNVQVYVGQFVLHNEALYRVTEIILDAISGGMDGLSIIALVEEL